MRCFALVLVACTPVPSAPESQPQPQAPARDASIDGPAVAAIDAPPDAAIPVRPRTKPCRYQHADASNLRGGSYRYQGVVPWVDIDDPVTSSCCVLPNTTVLCHVVEKTWQYIGNVSTGLLIEHVRLFDKNGKQPWFDIVVDAFQPGAMNDSGAASPPLFKGHVENDETALWIVGDRERVCEPNRALPCDAFLREAGACAGYRKALAPMVAEFCNARGAHVWSGTRFR